MQFKIITIPATGDPDAEDALNAFLRGHRVVSVRQELVCEGSARWCFCIEYIDGAVTSGSTKGKGRARVDYKEVLSEEDFAVFARLRDVRKELAAAEAVPVYAVCTNEQLAEMAKSHAASIAEMKKIDGFGDAKAEKYGQSLLEAIAKTERATDETSG